MSSRPRALYVHYPFCLKKCPYCDFYSRPLGSDAARDALYLQALGRDFSGQKAQLAAAGEQLVLSSLYVGGGTPTLGSISFFRGLMEMVAPYLEPEAEISLEANPATVSLDKLRELRGLGFNRISLGVQSFADASLRRLGRVHDGAAARESIREAREAGFTDLNVDLMHGLPGQDVAGALADLQAASALGAGHISWYELTLEEGTAFGRHPPPDLPAEDALADIEEAGFSCLEAMGFVHYEISGFYRDKPCRHNLNYWRFGDYLAVGAGAHAKLTLGKRILRRGAPDDFAAYMQGNMGHFAPVAADDLPFEYLLNRLRIFGRVLKSEFHEATGLEFARIEEKLRSAAAEGLMEIGPDDYALTPSGQRLLNQVLERFL